MRALAISSLPPEHRLVRWCGSRLGPCCGGVTGNPTCYVLHRIKHKDHTGPIAVAFGTWNYRDQIVQIWGWVSKHLGDR